MLRNCLLAGPPASGKRTVVGRLVAEHGFSRIAGDALLAACNAAWPDRIAGPCDPADLATWAAACGAWGPLLAALCAALPQESPQPYVIDTVHARPDDVYRIAPTTTKVMFLGYPGAVPAAKAAAVSGPSPADAPPGPALVRRWADLIDRSRAIQQRCTIRRLTFIDTGADFRAAIDVAVALATATEKVYAAADEGGGQADPDR